MSAAIFLAMSLAATSTPVVADKPAPRAVAGSWRLSEVGGKVGCTLSLTEATAIGGFEVKVPAACRLAFPPIKNLSAWNVDDRGAMVFSDPDRRRIVLFQARAGAVWEGAGPIGGAWRLERAPAKAEPTPSAGSGPGR